MYVCMYIHIYTHIHNIYISHVIDSRTAHSGLEVRGLQGTPVWIWLPMQLGGFWDQHAKKTWRIARLCLFFCSFLIFFGGCMSFLLQRTHCVELHNQELPKNIKPWSLAKCVGHEVWWRASIQPCCPASHSPCFRAARVSLYGPLPWKPRLVAGRRAARTAVWPAPARWFHHQEPSPGGGGGSLEPEDGSSTNIVTYVSQKNEDTSRYPQMLDVLVIRLTYLYAMASDGVWSTNGKHCRHANIAVPPMWILTQLVLERSSRNKKLNILGFCLSSSNDNVYYNIGTIYIVLYWDFMSHKYFSIQQFQSNRYIFCKTPDEPQSKQCHSLAAFHAREACSRLQSRRINPRNVWITKGFVSNAPPGANGG